jgi:hypothetical protein
MCMCGGGVRTAHLCERLAYDASACVYERSAVSPLNDCVKQRDSVSRAMRDCECNVHACVSVVTH